jgi:hypothetical protein
MLSLGATGVSNINESIGMYAFCRNILSVFLPAFLLPLIQFARAVKPTLLAFPVESFGKILDIWAFVILDSQVF